MKQKIDEKFNLENYYNYGNLLSIFSSFAPKPLPSKYKQPLYIVNNKHLMLFGKHQKSFIVLHAESNDPDREWHYSKWNELIDNILQTTNYDIAIIGLKQKINSQHHRLYDYSGKLSLSQTAALISKAHYFIGIDSGMAHIANALSIKATIILGKFRQMDKYMPYSGFFETSSNANIIFELNTTCSNVSVQSVILSLKNHRILQED
jgi:heptosyltransferase III